MLTGSMAMNYYAEPRMTRDIDLVIALCPEDAALDRQGIQSVDAHFPGRMKRLGIRRIPDRAEPVLAAEVVNAVHVRALPTGAQRRSSNPA